jgi:DNA polymerase III subunit alpha
MDRDGISTPPSADRVGAHAPAPHILSVMPGPGFIHLNVRSSYSLLHGAITISKLAELAKKDHQPALALTDTDNMFGALEFSDKVAGYGIQPIIGCALAIDFGDQEPTSRSILAQPSRVVLLAAREFSRIRLR